MFIDNLSNILKVLCDIFVWVESKITASLEEILHEFHFWYWEILVERYFWLVTFFNEKTGH